MSPGSDLLRAWPLSGGISARMTAVEFESPDGQVEQAVVRRYTSESGQDQSEELANEHQVLHLVQKLNILSPKPLFLELSDAPPGSPYLVMEYVDGKMDFSPTDLASYLGQMAKQLARLHGAQTAGMDLSFLPVSSTGCRELDQEISTNADTNFDQQSIRRKLRDTWPLAQKNENRLLHGDFWPGNILWHDGRLTAVIDWEDALVGDPLIDLAISRSEIVWIFGDGAMNLFTEAYQSLMPLEYGHLPYWDLCAALRQLRFAGSDFQGTADFFKPYGRADIRGDSIRENLSFFISQALDQLQE